jgi:hypothetical protein
VPCLLAGKVGQYRHSLTPAALEALYNQIYCSFNYRVASFSSSGDPRCQGQGREALCISTP